MMDLNTYIERHAAGLPKGAIASSLGISRSYLVEILSGAKKPGREAIQRIETNTGGLVPASVWFSGQDDCAKASQNQPSEAANG